MYKLVFVGRSPEKDYIWKYPPVKQNLHSAMAYVFCLYMTVVYKYILVQTLMAMLEQTAFYLSLEEITIGRLKDFSLVLEQDGFAKWEDCGRKIIGLTAWVKASDTHVGEDNVL